MAARAAKRRKLEDIAERSLRRYPGRGDVRGADDRSIWLVSGDRLYLQARPGDALARRIVPEGIFGMTHGGRGTSRDEALRAGPASDWRRPAIGIALIVAAIGVAALVHHHRRGSARMAVALAYRDLQVCLYGAPLPDIEIGRGSLRREAARFCRDPRREARSRECPSELTALLAAWA